VDVESNYFKLCYQVNMESNNKRRNDGRSLQGRRSFSSSVTRFVAVGGRLAAAAAGLSCWRQRWRHNVFR